MNFVQFFEEIPPNINAISEYLNDLLGVAIEDVNKNFSPRRLCKQPRDVEPLPTDPRQFSSYRTRIGTMLEYAISSAIDNILTKRYGDVFLFTFATSHEYPDFYLRDNALAALLKIEMKAVDAESDEQAARFSTPTNWINYDRDILMLLGWEWENLVRDEQVIGEYPHLFAGLMIPAGEVANERDIRLTITGGKIEGDNVYVLNRSGEFGLDPGNYGKFWRIIHSSRRNSDDLSKAMKVFLDFLEVIDSHSPRDRF